MLPPEAIIDAQQVRPDDAAQQASEQAENLFDSVADGQATGSMSLVFHTNGRLETYTDFPMASTGKPKVGKWSVLSWDKKRQVAKLRCDLFDEITETTVTFIDDHTIQLVPPNIAVLEMELRFRRNQ